MSRAWFSFFALCLMGAGPGFAGAKPSLGAPSTKTERLRILLIGDSHATGTFGKSLDLLLRTIPSADVTTFGACGATPETFLDGTRARCGHLRIEPGTPDWKVSTRIPRTPRIQDLLVQVRPHLTIVQLGANQLHTAYRDPKREGQVVAELAAIITRAGGDCLWVGPPVGRNNVKPHHKMDHLYGVIGKNVGACKFLDSRPTAMPFLDYERITEPLARKGDGKHYDGIGTIGRSAARHWALVVFGRARRMLKVRMAQNDPGPRPTVIASTDNLPSGRWLDLRFRHDRERVEGVTPTLLLRTEPRF